MSESFNGPGRELNGSHDDETVYCVDCGNVFVWARGRDCPTCTLREMMEDADE